MKRWLMAGGLVLLAGGAASLADPPERQDVSAAEAEGSPRIEFDVSSHDFGRQVAGEDLKTTFDFKNVGDATLRILQVKGG